MSNKKLDLLDIDSLKNRMLEIEINTNKIYDVQATYYYNLAINKLGENNIKIMPIKDKEGDIIGGIYINKLTNSRYMLFDSIIFLNDNVKLVEQFINKKFHRVNVHGRLPLYSDMDLSLHRPKYTSKTVIIKIENDENLQLKKVKKTRRQSIVKGSNIEGIRVRELNSIDDYLSAFEILKKHAKDRGYEVGQTKEKIKMYYELLRPLNLVHIIGCFINDKLVAGIILLCTKNLCRTESIFVLPELTTSGVPSFIMWKTILFCQNINVKYLDLAGYPDNHSYLSGIGYFKKSFGGDIVEHKDFDENIFHRFEYLLTNNPIIQSIYKFYKERSK